MQSKISPMMAILDIFMLITLALIMESSPDIKIILKKPIKDMVIVAKDSKNRVINYYDTAMKKWEPITNMKMKQEYSKYIIGNLPCNGICKDIPEPNNNLQKVIYLKGKLAYELSSLIADSCLAFPKQCVNVHYHINKNGFINKNRLRKEYPIFNKILRKEQSNGKK